MSLIIFLLFVLLIIAFLAIAELKKRQEPKLRGTPPKPLPRRMHDDDGAQECWVLKGQDGAACITFAEPSETFGRCGHFTVTKGTFIPDHPTP